MMCVATNGICISGKISNKTKYQVKSSNTQNHKNGKFSMISEMIRAKSVFMAKQKKKQKMCNPKKYANHFFESMRLYLAYSAFSE